jgi:MoxR-like ATPase
MSTIAIADPPPTAHPLAHLRWHDDARAALAAHRLVLLVGPPGTGKSTFAEREAWRLTSRAPLRLQGTSRTEPHHLWGRVGLNSGNTTFEENVLHRALVEGRVLVVEDFGLIPHEVRAAFLALRGDLPITNPETGETLVIPPTFRLVATTNDERVGCRRTGVIARALLDDFLVVEVEELPREDALALVRAQLASHEPKLVERAFELWWTCRDLHREGDASRRIRPSVRAVGQMVRLLEAGIGERRAASMALVGKFVLDADAHEAAKNFLALQDLDEPRPEEPHDGDATE